MNLYDSIENPMEDSEKLIQLIDFYIKNDAPKREIYNRLISGIKNRYFDKEKYIKDYENLIVKPTRDELYKNIEKRINLNEELFGENSLILKNVFKECPTYDELEKKIEGISDEKGKNALKKCKWILQIPKENLNKEIYKRVDPEQWYKDAKKFYSDEEIYSLAPFVVLKRVIEEYLLDKENVMGFHVNFEKKMDLDKKNEKNELKFYINAGDDTCKVASMFRDRCEARNINYYFKVVNPDKDDLERSDKLCIYSELKHVQDYLEILHEIRKENPELIFEQPPMMVGMFENWIGVATDHLEGETSYNVAMSNICLKALDKVCGEKKLNNNNNIEMGMLEQLKEEIAIQAEEMGYSKDKICVKRDIKKVLTKMNPYSPKNINAILKIHDVKKSIRKSHISILEVKDMMNRLKDTIAIKLKKQDKKAQNKKDMGDEQVIFRGITKGR